MVCNIIIVFVFISFECKKNSNISNIIFNFHQGSGGFSPQESIPDRCPNGVLSLGVYFPKYISIYSLLHTD